MPSPGCSLEAAARSLPAPLLHRSSRSPARNPACAGSDWFPPPPSHTHSLRKDLFQLLHSHTADPFLSRASQQLKPLKPSNVLNNTAQELEANVKSEGAVHTCVHIVLLGEIF